jgi:hypothetical protein
MNPLLNFVNPGAIDLGDAFDIPHERRIELAILMDGVIDLQGIRLDVPMTEQVEKFQDFCESYEELFWCWTNHIQWLIRKGRIKFVDK